MKIRFVWVGKTRDEHVAALERKYLDRLRRLCRVECVAVAESIKKDVRQVATQLEKEGDRVLSATSDVRCRIVLDEQGESLSSQQFSDLLVDLQDRAVSPISFVIGGYGGLPGAVRNSAHRVLSLGRMTLPHELARVVLLEQVYRGVMISRGLPYHR